MPTFDPCRTTRKLAYNNALANHRLHEACSRLKPGEFEAARVSFFPSIKATLNHILTVDWFYVDALEGGTLGPTAWDVEEPFDDIAALAAEQAKVDRRLVALCEAATPEKLASTTEPPESVTPESLPGDPVGGKPASRGDPPACAAASRADEPPSLAAGGTMGSVNRESSLSEHALLSSSASVMELGSSASAMELEMETRMFAVIMLNTSSKARTSQSRRIGKCVDGFRSRSLREPRPVPADDYFTSVSRFLDVSVHKPAWQPVHTLGAFNASSAPCKPNVVRSNQFTEMSADSTMTIALFEIMRWSPEERFSIIAGIPAAKAW